MKGKLYLIPATLGESDVNTVLPSKIFEIVETLDEFIVEQEKTARHFLKSIGYKKSFDTIILHPLNKHSSPEDVLMYLDNAVKGKNIGLLSEAGCPCIADPGNIIVEMAHEKQIQVIPLVGPSSIYLSLMASGFNGQNFAFNGYLPIDKKERTRKIKEIENLVYNKSQTQIFIETPYRNNQLLQDILKTCNGGTKLCIACCVSLPDEYIATKTISQWQYKIPDFNKKNCIFLIYK
jgi:16S rRNA (cytidine1402-2'-O)-methyltransferase